MLKKLFPGLAKIEPEKLLAAPMIILFWLGIVMVVVQAVAERYYPPNSTCVGQCRDDS